MNTDAQPAASSAAVESPAPETVSAVDQAVAAKDVAAFREARSAERLGKPLTVVPESSPGPVAEQPASTEVTEKPASEPGKPQRNAETRVRELLEERARERERAATLERELAELKARLTPPAKDGQPASSPAAAKDGIAYPAELTSYDAFLAAHPDATYEEYSDARSDFRSEAREQLKTRTQQEAQTREQRQQAIQQRDQQFRERLDAAVKADPEFLNGISEEVQALKPFDAIRDASGRWKEQPTGYHGVAEQILGSDVAPLLMRHFSDHPEDLHRIAKLDPVRLIKEVAKIEDKLSRPDPPKTVTSAPRPPTTLGSKPSAATDPVEAAVVSGDVAAFRAAREAERRAGIRR